LGAALGYIIFNPNSTIPLLGASGAIAGVLAGYLTLHFSGIVRGFFVFIIIPFRIALPAVIFIGYWFILQLFSSTASLAAPHETGGVAFLAHVFGFIAGLLLAPLLVATKVPA
jgi:membrane associated rhomboid family serine protease